MRAEIGAIRKSGSDLPVTVNMMPGVRDTNYAEFAPFLDIISWDAYPDWHSPQHLFAAQHAGFWHDYFRALKQKPFLLMESAPAVTNWKPINKLKRPGMDRLSALQAVAHGSDSVQYFQFRKSRGSSEKFHGAVVDHVGTDETRIFREIAKTGETLSKIGEVLGTSPHARVAILYDFENRWALTDAQGFVFDGGDKDYAATCVEYYRFFWERGISVDVVAPHADLSRYALVIAPQLYMTDADTEARLTDFVREGGTLYATYMLGYVNESDLCHLGGFPANGLKDVFGIWNEEIDTLYPTESVAVDMGGTRFAGKTYCELIHARGAEVLATYQSEFYAGMPALTRNRYGKGVAYYQAFRDADTPAPACGTTYHPAPYGTGSFKDAVFEEIIAALGMKKALSALPRKGVTAHTRTDGTHTYLFVENYSGEPIADLALDGTWLDLEENIATDRVSLDGFDVRILKK